MLGCFNNDILKVLNVSIYCHEKFKKFKWMQKFVYILLISTFIFGSILRFWLRLKWHKTFLSICTVRNRIATDRCVMFGFHPNSKMFIVGFKLLQYLRFENLQWRPNLWNVYIATHNVLQLNNDNIIFLFLKKHTIILPLLGLIINQLSKMVIMKCH